MNATTVVRKILIVDDHPVVRQGIGSILTAGGEFAIAGSAGTAAEAMRLIEAARPDLVLTDLGLPGRNGIELIKDLRALQPKLPVLVMSMHDELIYAERALRAGGRGYVMKEAPAEVMLNAVRRVLDGGVFVSEAVTGHFLESMSSGSRAKASFPLQRLTDRELEIFELIGRGRGNHEIARELSISIRTVDAHRTHIREKLGLADGTGLTRYAVRWIESSVID